MDIPAEYLKRRQLIKKRLADFKMLYSGQVSWFYNAGDIGLRKVMSDDGQRLFEEMCFCILAANGTAASSMKAVDASRDILMHGSEGDIQKALKSSGVRFHNRAEYIVYNRENLRKDIGLDIKKIIESYEDKKELREFLADYIKGFGFKESSHFLRNIGVGGFAILDKHILRSMHELGFMTDIPKSLAKKKYLETEKYYMLMSRALKIDPDELDLLLWSMKNGRIMK